ncbi:MAG TPA: hypothetical protein VN924_15460 [Bryobacteraceae bacterium]|nr:hypothetical protein [Bryobacteraceae bacterium]
MLKTTIKFDTIGCLLIGLLTAGRAFAQATATTTTTAADGTTKTTKQTPPTGVEIEVGLGSRLGREVSNYQSNSGTLSLTSLGRATPQLLTGLGFSFCETGGTTKTTKSNGTETVDSTDADTNAFCKNPFAKRLGVFASIQFGTGSSQTISGYTIGGTIALSRYLRFLAGSSETPVSQISPGFANAAAQYVSKNASLFPGVSPANLASNAYGAFDGIQTTSTAPMAGAAATSIIYYPGAVTETHYRGGFMVGVSMPINIYNLFGGNSKTSGQ